MSWSLPKLVDGQRYLVVAVHMFAMLFKVKMEVAF